MLFENERDFTIKFIILILSTSLFWTCSNSVDPILEGWNELPGAIFSGGVAEDLVIVLRRRITRVEARDHSPDHRRVVEVDVIRELLMPLLPFDLRAGEGIQVTVQLLPVLFSNVQVVDALVPDVIA